MQTLEAIKLITAEKEAIKRIIDLETQRNITAGGDAVVGNTSFLKLGLIFHIKHSRLCQ